MTDANTNTISTKLADQVSKVNIPDVKVHKASIEASVGDMEVNINYDETAENPTDVSVSST